MTQMVAAAKLPGLDTTALIAQYDHAISTYAGRYSNTAPRQKRINRICDLLFARADAGDAEADAWLADN